MDNLLWISKILTSNYQMTVICCIHPFDMIWKSISSPLYPVHFTCATRSFTVWFGEVFFRFHPPAVRLIKMSSYQSRDHLIFNIGIPAPGKDGLYIETGPCFCNRYCFPASVWHASININANVTSVHQTPSNRPVSMVSTASQSNCDDKSASTAKNLWKQNLLTGCVRVALLQTVNPNLFCV